MNQTIKLLKIIGSPFIKPVEVILKREELPKLYNYALRNKIALLFLDRHRKKADLERLESVYKKRYARYLKINALMSEISQLLIKADVEHAIFKTIRPYIAETSDVDILILRNDKEYFKAIKIFRDMYSLLGYGPESMTFYSSKADIGIDFYRNIAVSHLVYLNKEEIAEYTIKKDFCCGQYVMTLTPEADLLAIISHSIIKEQMFTLGEYYTFLYHLSNMDKVEKFVNLLNDTSTNIAARAFLSLTSTLHQAGHGRVPLILEKLLDMSPDKTLEAGRISKNNFKMPHKYSLLTIAEAISEKLKDERTKRSLAIQLWNMLKPSFTKTIIRGVLEHWIRETY